MSSDACYRISRHALLIFALLMVALNQAYMTFVGIHFYFLVLFILLSYVTESYFNTYFLIPRFFLQGKYAFYMITFSIMVLMFVLVRFTLEFLINIYYNVPVGAYFYYYKASYSRLLLELAASYLMEYIAVMSVGLTVILKHWLVNDQKIVQLERTHMLTEVDKMKEQVSPHFLFSVLHKIGDIVPENQEKASAMLMELSDILRYQLYDCNREYVLLSAEIRFIMTYLQIEKLYRNNMDFNIETQGDIRHQTIPPLLFIPLVQSVMKSFEKDNNYFKIQLYFSVENNAVSFRCCCRNAELLSSADLTNFRQRLERLYHGRQILRIENEAGYDCSSVFLQIS